MPEIATFAQPLYKDPPATTAELVQLDMNKRLGRIYAVMLGNNGIEYPGTWSDQAGENATALMRSLNKANLSIKSLEKRVMEQGVSDGKWPVMTISGAPD